MGVPIMPMKRKAAKTTSMSHTDISFYPAKIGMNGTTRPYSMDSRVVAEYRSNNLPYIGCSCVCSLLCKEDAKLPIYSILTVFCTLPKAEICKRFR